MKNTGKWRGITAVNKISEKETLKSVAENIIKQMDNKTENPKIQKNVQIRSDEKRMPEEEGRIRDESGLNKRVTVWKGLIVGATMMVPGVSGGSMAMILGIYDRLISAVSSFRKKAGENLLFLILFTVSAGAGMVLFSSPLSWLLERYPAAAMYFFLGAVFGGIPMIQKKSGATKLSGNAVLCMLAGVGCVMLFSLIPDGTFQTEVENGLIQWLIFLTVGILTAVALVLPGISFSHFFLILGLYEPLLQAVRTFDFMFLLPLGLGLMIGILLFSRALEHVMMKYPKQTYLIILGFILGSAAQIFPGIPDGWTLILCAALAAAGFGAVYWISAKES